MPSFLQSTLVSALRNLQAGRYDETVRLCRQVLAVAPRNFDAHHYLGVALGETGHGPESIKHLREAVRLNPGIAEAQNNLGKALRNEGREQESLRVFKALTQRAPHYEEGFIGIAQSLQRLNRYEDVVQVLTPALERFKGSWALLNERGKAYLALKRPHEAALDFEKAAHLNIESDDIGINLAEALIALKKHQAARLVIEDLLRRKPDHLPAKHKLLSVYRFTWQSEKALALAREIAAGDPGDLEFQVTVGECLVDLGKNTEASEVFRGVIAQAVGQLDTVPAGDPIDALEEAVDGLAPIHKFRKDDPEPGIVERLLLRPAANGLFRRRLLYVKSKIEDDIGNPGGAVEAAIAAKAIQPFPDEFARHCHFVRGMLNKLDQGFFERMRSLGTQEEQPVFILGMPRSGTTLTEQIIASHALADGAGELAAMPAISHRIGFDSGSDATPLLDYVQKLNATDLARFAEEYLLDLRRNPKPGVLRITDKMPHNFQHIWLIALIFPKARIIHCRRNPVDVCMSIFLRNFSGGHWYTRDLKSLGKFYNLYKDSTAHWQKVCGLKWYEHDYEAMVANPEPHIRKLIAFLDLPWDDKCLAHTETERSIHTFSKWQARQPIYTSSVEKWRKYAPYIGPLLKELGIEA